MRTVLVSGGSGGIGKSICLHFLNSGYKVIATCTNLKQKSSAIEHLENLGVTFHELDITKYEDCLSLEKKLTEQKIIIDTLVNNAGITSDSTFRKMEYQQWATVIDTNLTGTINLTKAFLNNMLERKFGRIVNISSINGLKGQFGQCNYSASKAGIIGFTKSLAQEVATKGITVNAISPGYIETEMTGKIKPIVLESIIQSIPMKRMGKPDEVAHAISFICDEKSAFLSGENLNLNGAQF